MVIADRILTRDCTLRLPDVKFKYTWSTGKNSGITQTELAFRL